MREILFKGKTIAGEWLYGSLITYGERSFIYTANGSQEDFHFYGYEVLPETVGQFLGITDKNGVKVFEGDIINETGKVNNGDSGTKIVENQRIAVTSQNVHGMVLFLSNYRSEMHHCAIEVIGSIHDNHELLNNQQNVR